VNGNEGIRKMCSSVMDECAIDLLTKMVQLEPSRRISAKEALEHPFFREYGKENVNMNCNL
jgi:serine/threonine protein kinase